MYFLLMTSFFEKDRIADAVIIATPDMFHVEPAIKAIEKGYHVLLEKPLAPDIEGIRRVYTAYKKGKVRVIVAHVLRYTSFFKKIKNLLEKEVIGKEVLTW